MGSRSPNPAYKAATADTTDAYVLAVNLSEATDPNEYIVANEGITEHSGSLNPQTSDTQYLHTGLRSSKTGNQRQFALAGDRFSGDEFQDAVLAHGMKYGLGNTIVRDYVYFNALTGLGEKGKIAIMVEDDTAGAAGENATFSATLYAQGIPDEYTYAPATP
ncbi:hypothetical protein LJB76_02790 [Clostridia bacterium OttesenSCG-928-O13]|nr:hypothetical protein [Clostridia bacterium OttesenSCG-928-O13]